MQVMAVLAVMDQDVQIHLRVHRELLQELKAELRIIDSKLADVDRIGTFIREVEASAQIDGDGRQRLVHRQREMAVTSDALFIAQRVVQKLAEKDGRIFDGMVAVDLQIAAQMQIDIDEPVLRNMREHMLEERNLGIKVRLSVTVQPDRQADVGLRGLACALGASICHTSRSSVSSRRSMIIAERKKSPVSQHRVDFRLPACSPPLLWSQAQVAELVYALVSGTSGSNLVEVQVLSWAHRHHKLSQEEAPQGAFSFGGAREYGEVTGAGVLM